MRSLTKTMFHPDFNVAKLNTGASLVAQMVKNLPAMQEETMSNAGDVGLIPG